MLDERISDSFKEMGLVKRRTPAMEVMVRYIDSSIQWRNRCRNVQQSESGAVEVMAVLLVIGRH